MFLSSSLPLLSLVANAIVLDANAEEPNVRGGNQLSKRAQRRYQDVLTETNGSRWRGRILSRGEQYRILLDDGSEVVVPQAEVASVTRELHPGLLHTAQWGLRAALGGEVAFALSDTLPGLQSGPMLELALTRNFQGPFEPELILVVSPYDPDPGGYQWQIGVGTRYYLNYTRRAKPFTYTQVILYGQYRDLALRTGPGFMLDLGPNFGMGFSQGVTLLSQREPDDAVAVGYHVLITAQARF